MTGKISKTDSFYPLWTENLHAPVAKSIKEVSDRWQWLCKNHSQTIVKK